VAREIVPPSAAARADAPADLPSGPVEHVGEQVRAIQAVRATNANAFSPAFASDGTAIFFHTGRERDARSAIEVATAGSQTGGDLGIMTIVDDGSHNYHAQPSPDGRFVAFDSDRDGERGIYVANRDGSQVRRVSGAGYAAVPTWSRNNEWLAYIRAEADKPSVWNLWVQPAAGGRARRLTNYRYGQTWAASWFPDDRRIAYSHEDTLMVMDLQTGEATRYRTPVKGQLVRTPRSRRMARRSSSRSSATAPGFSTLPMARCSACSRIRRRRSSPGRRMAAGSRSTAAATASGAFTCCRAVAREYPMKILDIRGWTHRCLVQT
jgi:hypothetical protein